MARRADPKDTVLVTGANSGLGLATALELARRGYRSVGSVRSEAKAEVVATAAEEAGVAVETILLDVNDEARCAGALEELGPLYGLVNNAGFGRPHAVETTDDEEARAMLETMVVAPMRLARLALPGMRANGRGRIINISSIYGEVTTPMNGWYQASKHALEAVSDALRLEVAADGIRVVLIQPGGFRTGIWDEMQEATDDAQSGAYAEAFRRSLKMTEAWHRFMGDPQDVAELVGKALSVSIPRARYRIGSDAHVLKALEQVTPTMVMDKITRKFLGL